MRNVLSALFIVLVTVSFTWAQEEKDVEGGQDHPLLSRMPGFYMSDYSQKDFDSYQSDYIEGDAGRWEGKLTNLSYHIKTGARQVSMVQIERNYENAVKKLGGKILYHDERVLNAKIEKDGTVTYVSVQAFNDGINYQLIIVESKEMEQEVTADAAALSESIASTGKAAVYGIYFDTGKFDVKPESGPALDEITKLLKQNPSLALYVVGHTDNVGTLESNLKLSANRADAVVKALIGRGIDGSRLKSSGVGPYCPVASNATDEGKAKNRRVELVQQ
ncbi:MAG TPA: OmpA family protein [Candidatus Acidoferrales bacterium]|nr:OmpA family protein [Candidatus Acidoferrales bacterium]